MTNASYWRQKWETNNIAFHERQANPALVNNIGKLSLPQGARVFVPLCGKTLDIHWLLAQGYRVAGAELVEIAIQQLFDELNLEPLVTDLGELKHYSAEKIDIFVGDIFQLSDQTLGSVDAVYDRAALVALPKEVRDRYTAHLVQITHTAPQLLIAYTYDQTQMSGPPFSISAEEVHQQYCEHYSLTLASNRELPNGLKGKCAAQENVWILGSSD